MTKKQDVCLGKQNSTEVNSGKNRKYTQCVFSGASVWKLAMRKQEVHTVCALGS